MKVKESVDFRSKENPNIDLHKVEKVLKTYFPECIVEYQADIHTNKDNYENSRVVLWTPDSSVIQLYGDAQFYWNDVGVHSGKEAQVYAAIPFNLKNKQKFIGETYAELKTFLLVFISNLRDVLDSENSLSESLDFKPSNNSTAIIDANKLQKVLKSYLSTCGVTVKNSVHGTLVLLITPDGSEVTFAEDGRCDWWNWDNKMVDDCLFPYNMDGRYKNDFKTYKELKYFIVTFITKLQDKLEISTHINL